ncbi:MAG: Unknown protein [uncultured Sulfurovum sp.]|uniref:Uncharacterized protein n=1 Tax=uncultured Sulfurovum sp. TaxID=269237 RepID=A0A6S6SBC6_9BACT|nr:MAG: Unknown protein [uncultured Sulfurovum sp.]
MKKILLNIFILLFTLNINLLGNSMVQNPSNISSDAKLAEVTQSIETVEIPLNSFGTLGVIVMIVLSSLLGAFFMKDEFSKNVT